MLTVFAILVMVPLVPGNVLTEVKDEVTHHHRNITNEVTIYTESNYWGIHWTIALTNCTDVPALFYKKAASINTHDNCVLLYGRQNCQGRHVKVAPGTDGHSHLSELNFEDTLASLKLCDDNWDSQEKKTHKRQERRSTMRRRVRSADAPNDLPGNVGTPESDHESVDSNSEENDEDILQALFESLGLNKASISRFQIQNDDAGKS